MPNAPTLTTPRLLLRAIVPADAAAIVALLSGDRAGVDMTGAIPWPVTLTGTQAWVNGLPHGEEIAWAITRRDTGELAGCASLRGGGRVMHLGYWVGLPHRGQGFATEAARAVMDHARETGAWEVRADVMMGNDASARVLHALGFLYLGDVTQDYPARGGARRVRQFALELARHGC